ncbi:hypothetical protein ACOSQ2_005762 [Xanthoceras sorbifolium]
MQILHILRFTRKHPSSNIGRTLKYFPRPKRSFDFIGDTRVMHHLIYIFKYHALYHKSGRFLNNLAVSQCYFSSKEKYLLNHQREQKKMYMTIKINQSKNTIIS